MLSHFLGFLQTPFSTKAWSHCRCQSICKIYHVLCRGRSRGRKVLVAFNTKSSNKEEMLICPRRSNVLDVQMSSTFRRPRCSNVIDVQLLSTFKRYQRSNVINVPPSSNFIHSHVQKSSMFLGMSSTFRRSRC